MTFHISTDVELAYSLSDAVGAHYKEGVRCIQLLPKHALVMFRHVLEGLCDIAQEPAASDLQGCKDLYRRISELKDAGLITFANAHTLHKIRQVTNSAAHLQPASQNLSLPTAVSPPDCIDVLPEVARGVRTDLVSLFISLYDEKMETPLQHSVKFEELEDLQVGQDLYLASTTVEAKDKYKAGLICEALTERALSSVKTLIVPNDVDHQITFLKRQAALFFQASDQLESNDDARYRYALAVWEGLLDADRKAEAFEILREVADRGHGEACLYFGVALSTDLSKLDEAVAYWERAIQLGYPKAYFCIGQLYLADGAKGPDYENVLRNWNLGEEAGDADCIYGLGRLYFEDKFVAKDDGRADAYLTKAAKLGHRGAQVFKAMYLDGGLEELQRFMADFGKSLQARARKPKREPVISSKQPANGPCPCGSGQKYKKCCGSGKRPSVPSLPPFGG